MIRKISKKDLFNSHKQTTLDNIKYETLEDRLHRLKKDSNLNSNPNSELIKYRSIETLPSQPQQHSNQYLHRYQRSILGDNQLQPKTQDKPVSKGGRKKYQYARSINLTTMSGESSFSVSPKETKRKSKESPPKIKRNIRKNLYRF